MTSTVLTYETPPQRDSAAFERYALLALLCAAAAIAYAQRSAIAVPAEMMQVDLRMDKPRFGMVMSIWALGYALAQIPAGWLGDQWGSRRSLTLFALCWSLATGLVAVAGGYVSLSIIWFLMGIAQAGLFPCAARAIRRSFPESRRATATGILATFMGVGAAVGTMSFGLLLLVMNWRWVFGLFALPGIAWALLFYGWHRAEPERVPKIDGLEGAVGGAGNAACVESESGGHSCPPEPIRIRSVEQECSTLADSDRQECLPHRDLLATHVEPGNSSTPAPLDYAPQQVSPWILMLGSASMWLLCAQQFLRGAAMIFFATWFPTFLSSSRHVTVARSGVLTALAGVGAIFGSLLGGFGSDKVFARTGNRRLSRQGIAVAGMLACATLIVVAYFIANTTLAVAVISAGAFCGTFGGVSGYTVAMDFGGKRVSLVFSIMNMCGNVGASIFPVAIGWLVNRTGNWDMVLFIFAGIFAVDAICWALLNPRRPLFEE